jgi:hypothetical protein
LPDERLVAAILDDAALLDDDAVVSTILPRSVDEASAYAKLSLWSFETA